MLVLLGDCYRASRAQVFGEFYFVSQRLIWIFLQDIQETIITNLEHLWGLINASACCSAYIEVNGYLHGIRLVGLFGIFGCAVLSIMSLKCIEHRTQ